MNKHLQRVICLLLLIGMIACTVACNGGAGDSSENPSDGSAEASGATSEGNDYLDADGDYFPKLGVLEQYKDKTFTVLVVGEGANTYQSDDFTTEAGSGGIDYGDTYYTKVKERNDKIKTLYDVELIVDKTDDTENKARNDILTGDQKYDAVVLTVETMTTLAQDGMLTDLNTLKNFDKNAPWWDASANEAYSIGDKLYFSTGDITIMNKANVWSILFNKDMIKDNNLESPYTLFNEGKWTFDKMCEMAETVNTATVNPDYTDSGLVYGMVTAYGDIVRFYGASGMLLCSKDAKNEPMLEFGSTEASYKLTQNILERINGAAWKVYAELVSGAGFTQSFKMFYDGHALFRPSGFTAVTKCRSLASIQFGIVPMPKMLEGQDEYYVTASGTFVAGILKNCRDAEFSAYMLDAYAAGAKNYITPAYIDKNLKTLSLRDDESEACLEYIFSHIVYDVGLVYNFGNMTNVFRDLASSNSSEIVSSFEAISETVKQDIVDVIDAYASDVQ